MDGGNEDFIVHKKKTFLCLFIKCLQFSLGNVHANFIISHFVRVSRYALNW